ncbi:MAG TPA: hypothetical protein VIL07_10105 [Symbiobacteriaceae bacterium]
MHEEDLRRAVEEAAARLRQEGWEARAEGTRLLCRAPGGLKVEIENRLAPGEASRWDGLLDRLAAALLEAAVEE